MLSLTEFLNAPPESYSLNLNAHLKEELARIQCLVCAFLIQQKRRTIHTNPEASRNGNNDNPLGLFRPGDGFESDHRGYETFLADAARIERHIIQRLRRTPESDRNKLPVWTLVKRFELIPNLASVIPPNNLLSENLSADTVRDTLALDLVLLAYLLIVDPNCRIEIIKAVANSTEASVTTEIALQIVQPRVGLAELRWNCLAADSMLRQLLSLETLAPYRSNRESFEIDLQVAAFLAGKDLPTDPVTGEAVRVVHKWRGWDRVRLDAAVIDQLRALSSWWWHERGNNPLIALFRGPQGTPYLEALQAMVTWSEDNKPTRLAWTILVVDTSQAPKESGWADFVRRVYREAQLRQSVVLWNKADSLLANPADGRIAELINRSIRSRVSSVLASTIGWDPSEFFQAPDRFFVQVDMPTPAPAVRRATWKDRLFREGDDLATDSNPYERATLDLLESFEFTQGEIEDAIAAARGYALISPKPADDQRATRSAELLVEACRRQASRRHISFTQRIVPRPMQELHDQQPKAILRERVILPIAASQQLDELYDRIAHLSHVYQGLGFENRLSLGRGIIALFTGSPGTGKTLAATTLANLLKKDLYKVDASAVASKFVGETERNLGRVFADVQGANAILFFDEADALFGKRGEVVQAADRWANLQISYLLQRVEEYTGTVILASNSRDSIDPAFFRRLQVLIEFPRPDALSRLKILQGLLSGTHLAIADASGRKADSADAIRAVLKPIADRFDLSGGNLKNVVLDAAFRAVAKQPSDPTLTQHELLLAVARELQKEGKPISVVTFGKDWYNLVAKELHLGRSDSSIERPR